MVKKQEGEVSLELLKNALAGTFWRMNVYGKKVFVIQDLFLEASLPAGWKGEPEVQKEIKFTEVLTSENKVYEIGDKFQPSKKDKIKLTGQIIDFKTNAPAVGIHVIRREPWTVAVTDENGNPIEPPTEIYTDEDGNIIEPPTEENEEETQSENDSEDDAESEENAEVSDETDNSR